MLDFGPGDVIEPEVPESDSPIPGGHIGGTIPLPGSGGFIDPDRGHPGGLASPLVALSYRAVTVAVPADWYSRWESGWSRLSGTEDGAGLVSSVDECLDFVWPHRAALAATSGLDDESVDGLLGCYDLLSVRYRSLFWRAGEGSHRAVYREMVRLVALYADDIVDRFMDPQEYSVGGSSFEFSWCEGLDEFCRSVLRGREAYIRSRKRKCRIAIHFEADDYRFDDEIYLRRCPHHLNRPCGAGLAADEPSAACKGKRFDASWGDWERSAWDATYRCYAEPTAGVPYRDAFPNAGCGFDGYGGDFKVDLHPYQLAWLGFCVDRILHRARVCYDYGRATGSTEHLTAARRLGAYALSPIGDWGRVLIHELGHTYMGQGGHCRFQSCFDVAAFAWDTAVRARLGLPLRVWDSGSTPTTTTAFDRDFGGGTVRIPTSPGTYDEKGAGNCPEFDRDTIESTHSSARYEYARQLHQAGVIGSSHRFCVASGWVRAEDGSTATEWDVHTIRSC
ncbi:MAG: hypothetical protein H6742_18710 [Alphaproteobacteria bacterium]|nr:hypothetical protein [Alphaproteobacteria bacterium]